MLIEGLEKIGGFSEHLGCDSPGILLSSQDADKKEWFRMKKEKASGIILIGGCWTGRLKAGTLEMNDLV